MKSKELKKKIEEHQSWLMAIVDYEPNDSCPQAKRMVLKNKDLKKTDFHGLNLSYALFENVDLSGADFSGCILRRTIFTDCVLNDAKFYSADLYGTEFWSGTMRNASFVFARITSSEFNGVDLTGASFQEANIIGTSLSKDDLSKVDFKNALAHKVTFEHSYWNEAPKYFPLPDLSLLKSVRGKIRAYKIINENQEGAFIGGLKYEIGKETIAEKYDSDERVLWSGEINVATLKWCRDRKEPYEKIIEVEFSPDDIVAIPYGTDGKFRIKKCKVIREVEDDD